MKYKLESCCKTSVLWINMFSGKWRVNIPKLLYSILLFDNKVLSNITDWRYARYELILWKADIFWRSFQNKISEKMNTVW